jgi:hypothetical protein
MLLQLTAKWDDHPPPLAPSAAARRRGEPRSCLSQVDEDPGSARFDLTVGPLVRGRKVDGWVVPDSGSVR